MALKPEELALSSAELAEVTELEKKVDGEIRQNHTEGQRKYSVYVGGQHSELTSRRVLNELIRRYKAQGWKAEVMWGHLNLEY